MSVSTQQKMIVINKSTLEEFMAHIVDQPDMEKNIRDAARGLARKTLGSPKQSFLNSMEQMKDFPQGEGSDFGKTLHGFFVGVHAGVALALCSNDDTIIDAIDRFTKALDRASRGGAEPVKEEVTDDEARAIAKREFAKMRTMGGKQ